jgi:hypothetical protein
MAEINIRRLMSGGIITNYFCTSRCGHCLYNCSPQWEKEYIDLFGNYIPGLCSGLAIAIEDLGQPLSDETYPLLTTLCRHGIRGLVKMAQEGLGYIPQKDLYINKCDLCTEVRTYMVQNDYRGSKELKPKEFYEENRLTILCVINNATGQLR